MRAIPLSFFSNEITQYQCRILQKALGAKLLKKNLYIQRIPTEKKVTE